MANKIVKMFKVIDAPKVICDLELIEILTPNEFMLYVKLLNLSHDFSPNVRWVEYLLGVSKNTALKAINGLKNRGLLRIEKVGYRDYVWYSSLRTYDYNEMKRQRQQEKERKQLIGATDELVKLNETLEEINRKMDIAVDEDLIKLQDEWLEVKGKIRKLGGKDV